MATVTFPTIVDNAESTISIAHTDSVTTITLVTGGVAALGLTGTTDAIITVITSGSYQTANEVYEQIRVTGESGVTLTGATRGYGGTTPMALSTNDIVEIRIVKEHIQALYDALTDGLDSIDIANIIATRTYTNNGSIGSPAYTFTSDTSMGAWRNIGSLILNSSGGQVVDLASDLSATFAGAVEVGGDLTLGASGVNKMWTTTVRPSEMAPSPTIPATLGTYVANSNRTMASMQFTSTIASEDIDFTVALPSDYDGSDLTFDLYWVAATGTGDVAWLLQASSFVADELLSASYSGFDTVLTTMTVVHDLHKTTLNITPTGADGDLLSVKIRRNGGSASDTHSGTAELLAVGISYT